MNFEVKKACNFDLLYKRFQHILDDENGCNEGSFTDNDLLIVFKLIDFFKVHASFKEKRDILYYLYKE